MSALTRQAYWLRAMQCPRYLGQMPRTFTSGMSKRQTAVRRCFDARSSRKYSIALACNQGHLYEAGPAQNILATNTHILLTHNRCQTRLLSTSDKGTPGKHNPSDKSSWREEPVEGEPAEELEEGDEYEDGDELEHDADAHADPGADPGAHGTKQKVLPFAKRKKWNRNTSTKAGHQVATKPAPDGSGHRVSARGGFESGTAAVITPSTHSEDSTSSPPKTPEKKSFLSPSKLNELFVLHFPHAGYIISAVAVLVSDMLVLRSLFVLANICGIVVNYYILKPAFMTGIWWNIFFIIANLVQIIRILLERRELELEDEEAIVYHEMFSKAFSIAEFRKLLDIACWKEYEKGEVIIAQGEELQEVLFIAEGMCRVEDCLPSPDAEEGETEAGRELIGHFGFGRLIGDIAVNAHMHQKAQAAFQPTVRSPYTVTVERPVRALCWKKVDLEGFFLTRPAMAVGWNAITLHDLMKTMRESRHMARKHAYSVFIHGILADGVVTHEEREAARLYQKKNSVSPDMHNATLEEFGWTEKDWHRGSCTPTVMERIAKRLHIGGGGSKPTASECETPGNAGGAVA